MAHFLLVHGSCHGAWCWRDTLPALRALGHSAQAIDLPGAGSDPTPLAGQTLAACRDAILRAAPPGTILVGHSWGGYPITAAAQAAPDRFAGLIYLCAYVPEPGLSLVQMRRKAAEQPILAAVIRAEDGRSYRIDPARAPDLFYHDCPPETVLYALPRLSAQATAPQETPLIGSLPDLPRAYVRCSQDRTIPPDYQIEMTKDWPTDCLHTLATSHSPFFADPTGLAALLARIGTAF